ncbi:MAG: dephospho-CoA kinase [Acuticoccus sp.]
MIRLGLTGSIGMGKSTAAGFFAAHGDAVVDADALVHALYRGRAVAPVAAAFPGVAVDGEIDRKALGAAVIGKPEAMARLEAIVHPMVREEEAARVAAAWEEGRRILILDIPLLFETGRETDVDAVVVVSAPAEIQRQRVLARPGMTDEIFANILSRQMPDAEKRRRAHFVCDTSVSLDDAALRIAAIRRAVMGIDHGRRGFG